MSCKVMRRVGIVFVMGGLGGIIMLRKVSVFILYSLMKNNDDPGVFDISLARDMYEYIYIYWTL
jgi:hypothetical protein